jgi:hypothetical protein
VEVISSWLEIYRNKENWGMLLERSLAICNRNEGPGGATTAIGNTAIGRFYYQLAMKQSIVHTKGTQRLLAKSYLDEGI